MLNIIKPRVLGDFPVFTSMTIVFILFFWLITHITNSIYDSAVIAGWHYWLALLAGIVDWHYWLALLTGIVDWHY